MSATRPTARTVAVHGSGPVQGSGALLAPAAREGLIDLSPLEALPGLRVNIIGGSRIIGGEGLIVHT
ncbi:hypothetical protein [Streptomyces sp. NBC_01320]|uniref:hypothetical protein n=1 Tax=Streptomyces sp. NBC_01320 TaxID=2903824 RepID=UPI002E0F82AD|nr:hypothetical protein OG395_30050 [Streptomyces sp. NBC_01320]